MTAVHVVVPDSIDDPARPSGGNTYDRRTCRGLTAIGWSVYECLVPGSWPRPDAPARAAITRVVAGIPDGAVMLIDGLIASTVPEVLLPHAGRLRVVVLVHMPLGDGPPGADVADARTKERAVLSAAAAVITTSFWTRRQILARYALGPGQVHVAEPGVDPADLASGTSAGGELLCVAAVTPAKGYDVLLAALATIMDRPWRCLCVGSLDRDPLFVERLGRQVREASMAERIRFSGALTGADLDIAYACADVLVLASRTESYGMVVTEALARGLPIVATNIGGLPEAVGRGADGSVPGLLVPPGDSAALAAALRCWLGDVELRQSYRGTARARRATLSRWSNTSLRISRILSEVAR